MDMKLMISGRFLIFAMIILATPSLPSQGAENESEIATDSVTVVGEYQRPGVAPQRSDILVPKTDKLDPGRPEQSYPDADVSPTASEDAKSSEPPVKGAPGRKESSGFRWWILLVIGGAAAAGAALL